MSTTDRNNYLFKNIEMKIKREINQLKYLINNNQNINREDRI